MNAKGVQEEQGRRRQARLLDSRRRSIARPHLPARSTRWSPRSSSTAQDIRRPLGIAHTYQPETLTLVGDFVIKGNLLLGGKRRATGLTLTATDVDWSARSGARGEGSAGLDHPRAHRDGRPGCPDLTGDGLATLTGADLAGGADRCRGERPAAERHLLRGPQVAQARANALEPLEAVQVQAEARVDEPPSREVIGKIRLVERDRLDDARTRWRARP